MWKARPRLFPFFFQRRTLDPSLQGRGAIPPWDTSGILRKLLAKSEINDDEVLESDVVRPVAVPLLVQVTSINPPSSTSLDI